MPKKNSARRSRPSGKSRRKAKDAASFAPCFAKHFPGCAMRELVTTGRTFPLPARVDLQRVLEAIFGGEIPVAQFLGVHMPFSHDTITLASLMPSKSRHGFAAEIGPLQYEDLDIGEGEPARCLKQALWLAGKPGVRFSALLSPAFTHGRKAGVHLEIGVMPGTTGSELTRRLFTDIERRVQSAGSYRGRVLSLEGMPHNPGSIGTVRVHRLKRVSRDQIVLPASTLALLDRNVLQFVRRRGELRALGMPMKKGLLFYGPPGTGKTHTVHYLAAELPEHTTLLITAEQVALLGEYMQLARFLQPAIVVIEDADLIARARQDMNSPCEESLLNRLLNEMDGLREDAELLFILTTNRPEQIESALAGRPGRIDQAVEFPLPDADGRRKLVWLYAGGLALADDIVELLVQKTQQGSAAFIKELMRRSAQASIEAGAGAKLTQAHVELALDEMLFSGGSLNRQLLGAAEVGAGGRKI